jgi:hypothetical protein
MANLDVQRKKKSPLPVILLILVILAIAGYFIWNQYNKQKTINPEPITNTTDSSNHLGSDTATIH